MNNVNADSKVTALDGLIILPPLTDEIMLEKKKLIRRNSGVPQKYLNTPLFLLSKGQALGKIIIKNYHPKDSQYYEWEVEVLEIFSNPTLYKHSGQVMWVKNVELHLDNR